MFSSKEAQKCFCGTEKCRGFLGGTKRIELRSDKRTPTDQEEEAERKKKGLFEDRDTVSSMFCHFNRLPTPLDLCRKGHLY